ncbi:hypothetical protein BGX26_003514, partial [Mortierella sp. AD094]
MSDISHDTNDELHSLREEIAQMCAQVNSLHASRNNLTQIDAPRAKILVISDELEEAMPSIDGKHFFIKPSDPDEDHLFAESANFPKNPNQQYHAPAINDMRLDNYVRATGAKPAPETEKWVYISKENITAHIKAAAEFAKASAPTKATQPNRKNKQGRGNRYGGYGFSGQYPQQRQRQAGQQQYQPRSHTLN